MSLQPQTGATVPSFDALNPYPWFAWMRQHEHVFQDPTTSTWYVFGYQDVLQVLNPPIKPTAENPLLFSSALPFVDEHTLTAGSIVTIDPPRQRAVRGLLNPAFSPKVLQDAYAARITAIIDGLLDQVIDARQMDVVRDLAYEIPVLVITELLDVPKADREDFKRWAARGVGRIELEESSVSSRVPELRHYFLKTIEERHHSPQGTQTDLISILVHGSPDDGVALSQQELLGNCELLLMAGFETTAHLLTNLFRVLSAFPDVQEQVWQNPVFVPALIEETLRYLSPVHTQIRWTKREVELGGKKIPENQLVIPLLGSANRDEEVFERAESFELMRFAHAAPTHVAFGFQGTHFCLGAPLARLEARLTMERLIARLKEIRVVPGVDLKPIRTEGMIVPFVNGVQSLPVTFQRC